MTVSKNAMGVIAVATPSTKSTPFAFARRSRISLYVNWLVWDAEPTDRQHGQHVEYTLQPEGGGTACASTSRWSPAHLYSNS